MGRNKLINAIANAVEEGGYQFNSGFEYRMNSEIKNLPAAWLLPPQLVKREGRAEGVDHYAVSMRLITIAEKGQSAKNEQWSAMERQAVMITQKLQENDAINMVSDLSCDVSEFALTNRGELSLLVRFKVQMPFNAKCS